MIPNHPRFVEAVQDRRKVNVRFYSSADSGFVDRVCAPMDYGPGDAVDGTRNRRPRPSRPFRDPMTVMNDIVTEASPGVPELRPEGTQARLRRILVVDDEPVIRKLTALTLGLAGYQVDTADDGAMAWESLRQTRYDLMVTDNRMPVLTGIELLKKIRLADIPLPVVMVTAFFPKDEVDADPWMQPDATVLKPFTSAELLEAVRTVLRWTALPVRSVPVVPR